ncbi:hypothetical protein [Hymenobacter terrenus]|uniref:hypothetical protein n=1 Tax=Hymenobacter terrenus TaxID=1629124 RepID=UPI000697BE49|nr:hypothetical protein [Hymenobacter terrenus]
MQKYLLSCLLVGLALPGFGQGRDTAFAVHKLFREKRAAGNGFLAAGATATTVAGSQYAQEASSPPTAQETRQNAVAGAAFAGAGMLKAGRYSTENEAYILKRYSEGWSIPPDIRRKLRRKHFHRSARDMEPNQ